MAASEPLASAPAPPAPAPPAPAPLAPAPPAPAPPAPAPLAPAPAPVSVLLAAAVQVSDRESDLASMPTSAQPEAPASPVKLPPSSLKESLDIAQEGERKKIEDKWRLARVEFDADALCTVFPPKLSSANKSLLFSLAVPPEGSKHSGKITFTRWRCMQSPRYLPKGNPCPRPNVFYNTEVLCVDGSFKYAPVDPHSGFIEWHLNFADKHLFGYYGGSLFAQDEMQVTEHPALASLREALHKQGDAKAAPITTEDHQPTPCLIRGVQRRLQIRTEPNEQEGRPKGLYGREFSKASAPTLLKSTTVLSPPTISNIIAMEALKYGRGSYTISQLNTTFDTAFTGFSAAILESHTVMQEIGVPHKPKVIIHTGAWGTGAYGGNRVVMVLLQVLAAACAGAGAIVYHAFDKPGKEAFDLAMVLLAQLLPDSEQQVTLSSFFSSLEKQKLCWGLSDGN